MAESKASRSLSSSFRTAVRGVGADTIRFGFRLDIVLLLLDRLFFNFCFCFCFCFFALSFVLELALDFDFDFFLFFDDDNEVVVVGGVVEVWDDF